MTSQNIRLSQTKFESSKLNNQAMTQNSSNNFNVQCKQEKQKAKLVLNRVLNDRMRNEPQNFGHNITSTGLCGNESISSSSGIFIENSLSTATNTTSTNDSNCGNKTPTIHLQHQQTTITQSPDWEQLVQMNSSPRSSIRFKNINPQNSNFNNYKNSNFNGFVPSNSPSNNSNNLYISSSSSSNINVL